MEVIKIVKKIILISIFICFANVDYVGADNMAVDLNLEFNGNTLPSEITQMLIDHAKNVLNVPPSYLIVKLSYEGLWGSSAVAEQNNNWSGMTWASWKEPYKRQSGVTITRGTKRPESEGGYYIKYNSLDDFFIDWLYLIRIGGVYNVGNSETFNEAVKGMFFYGGANRDYATMDLPDGMSKARYEKYLPGMLGRRNAINNTNNNALDIFDSEDYSSDPSYDPDLGNKYYDNIIDKLQSNYTKLKKEFDDYRNNVHNIQNSIGNGYLYNYNSSNFKGNSSIQLIKVGNLYKLNISGNVNEIIKDNEDFIDDKIEDERQEEDDLTRPDDPAKPLNNIPFFPHEKPYRQTSGFGVRSGGFHYGCDYADMVRGTSVPIYATQKGVVTRSGFTDSNGYHVYLKHTGDSYHSCYLHMIETPMVRLGDTVEKGQQLGMTGNTGNSEGVHLHFGISTKENTFFVKDGPIDPEKYLKMRF